MAKKASNTMSLASIHKGINKIHFIAGSNGFQSIAIPNSGTPGAGQIYQALANREYSKLNARPGVSTRDLVIVDGRTELSKQLELDFQVLRIFNNDTTDIIATKAKEIGRRALKRSYESLVGSRTTQKVEERFRRRIKKIEKMFRTALGDYQKLQKTATTLDNLENNILTKFKGSEPGKVFKSYNGSFSTIFGELNEFMVLSEHEAIAKTDQAITNIFLGKKYRNMILPPRIANMSQLADLSMEIDFRQFGSNKGSSTINVGFSAAPISLKSSTFDSARKFSGYTGNPIPYMSPEVFSDFINIYLSSFRNINAILAAMIADMALVSRTSATGEILFVIRRTPAHLNVYLVYELFDYYARQTLAKEVPTINISEFKYLRDPNPPFEAINDKLVEGATSDTEKGRKFFSSVAALKITNNGTRVPYVSVELARKTKDTKYAMTANVKGIFPIRKDQAEIFQLAQEIVKQKNVTPVIP